MSKILQRGQTGFGILIEHDAGYISRELNPLIINEGFQFEQNKPILINCILQKWGVENKNGRIYPEDILVPQVEEYQKLVETNAAISEADHPDSSVISLLNVSHMIKKMWWGTGDDKNVLYGQLRLVCSPAFISNGQPFMIGDKIVVYLQHGIKLGISSRGVGTLKEINGKNIVQNDFELIGFDLVSTPSTPGAYLFPDSQEMKFAENIVKKNGIPKLNERSERIDKVLTRFLN